jgi:hypothetical protein
MKGGKGETMTKKHYTVTLDEEAVVVVKGHLEKSKMSFSGFLNGIITELSRDLQGQPVMFDKPVKDLTLEEFGKLMGYWSNITKEEAPEA